MIASQLNFKGDDLHFGQIITSCYAIFIVFIPFFFPGVLFLAIAIAPMLLGLSHRPSAGYPDITHPVLLSGPGDGRFCPDACIPLYAAQPCNP